MSIPPEAAAKVWNFVKEDLCAARAPRVTASIAVQICEPVPQPI
jgi:hypothetical protein